MSWLASWRTRPKLEGKLPIRRQLYALVLAVGLPLIVLVMKDIEDDGEHDVRIAGTAALGLADNTAAYARESLRLDRELLGRLAELPLVRALDGERCDPLFDVFLQMHPEFANLVTVNQAGVVVCAAAPLPQGRIFPVSDTDWFQRGLREDRFIIGKPFLGRLAEKWSAMHVQPIHDDQGKVAGVIAAPKELANFLPPLEHGTLQAGTVYRVLDQDGTLIAGFPAAGEWMGKKLLGKEFADMARMDQKGPVQARGEDGVERIYGFSRIPGVNWHVAVGVPFDAILAENEQAMAHNALIALAIVLALIPVAWILSLRITEPIHRIAKAAKEIAAGRLDARAPEEGAAEIAEMGRQFNKMCDIRRRANAALKETSDRCQQLAHRLLEVQESERHNLAHKLHDEIGQALTAVKIHLQALQRPSPARTSSAHFDECIRTVEQALQQVRELSLNLRPPLLDEVGLSAALRSQLDRQGNAAGLTTRFVADTFPERPHPDLETVCFRVAQEAVTNVVRHAEANHVSVELRRRDEELHLLIRDDGKGFDPLAARERALCGASMGLLSMEERVSLAGGRLELASAPREGTRIHAIFPLTLANSFEGVTP